ncbi:hypothetical protein GUITHDRAFT_151956 [Guillardia theta CCMP2712]|uniref:G10 protein n=2 Tax=Guillardia theta TaxID=55529 RepID=L1JGV6_GUITC|nr:hypothetical protein GUITHDRAFT_151956 [Guillardia theta CCMP2712]EKX47753.1 hypothetical protein GUITHDRAFT_151956 [Guillardia theta CCMP2712]|mmetsp:Transcript_44417/g.140169  ORF Transcript_44417/g.140169 Transcript_44417/m.140169 type:complete len:202 (+) Transcript_44417:113-718(+)|eukprot:XP_005834733.1 hypothetical protein GUITHDRAFT_151956 [Guillardia theta CCMP2712]
MSTNLQRLSKKAPEGWDEVLPTLEMFENRMKDAVNESHEGKRKHESTWPIHRIHYEKSRYIYELYYTKKEISRELLDFCIREKVVDGNLMAKWKKPGYEFLCSLAAINKGSTNFGTTNVCRVPLRLRSGKITPSVVTGCISCASCDKGAPIWWNSNIEGRAGGSKRAADAEEDEEVEKRAAMLRGEGGSDAKRSRTGDTLD